MKQVHGWFLPESDTHFVAELDACVAQGMPAEYQRPHRDTAVSFCRRRQVAIDIGAHIGFWSRPLSHVFEHVISFEPIELFRELLSLNAPECSILPVALGERESTVAITVPDENSGMAHVLAGSEGTGPLEIKTLDSFDLDEADFIKIDCEGYEYPVLRGARRTLATCRPVICVEQKPHPHFAQQWGQYAAIEFLKNECGYSVVHRVRDDWVLLPNG